MKTQKPLNVLEQLRLQAQLDSEFRSLELQCQIIPEIAAGLARIVAEISPPLYMGIHQHDDIQRSEELAATLSDSLNGLFLGQIAILGSAISVILQDIDSYGAGIGAGEQELLSISQIASGLAGLGQSVHSTGLMCRLTATLIADRNLDTAEELRSLGASFLQSASQLQEIKVFLENLCEQLPGAALAPDQYKRYMDSLTNAQNKLDQFEAPELPNQPAYVPAFFAQRHERSESNIRELLKDWSERKQNFKKTRNNGRWCITDYEVAKEFDLHLWRNRRNVDSKKSKKPNSH